MRLTVDGRERDVDAAAHETLLEVLRDRLGMVGREPVCERGECGACTVFLDGAPAYACLALAAACEGSAITSPGRTGDAGQAGATGAARG